MLKPYSKGSSALHLPAPASHPGRGTGRHYLMDAYAHCTVHRRRRGYRFEDDNRCDRTIRAPDIQFSRYLASADLFVSPGERDSAAHAVLEAQAAGLPCVVMETGSAAERVSDASSIVCRSAVDLIIGTAALVRDPARRREMGRAARSCAVGQDWASGLAPLYAGYRTAAERSGARRDLRPAFISQSRHL